MAKAIHMMVRVLNEERSVAFYSGAFGLEIADRYDFADFTLVYLRNAETDFELELTVNKGRKDPYELGNGYGHFAVAVEDLEETRARIAELGYFPKDIKQMIFEDKPFGRFFFIEDPDGYKIEVLEKGGRFR
ncbi:lactoylglutathione lyase [Hyphomicrobium nitrativorans NL23]|uniref:Aldoketomutase n=1 Tax=Hyphomicrobium nitrativorans NL23 TaxID=1029756 RepID=V5SA57_9HYPH|nr:VOC family protein [Hyphomicrobium nitrativorans]AHB47302.1 lactoylglutathione lyase [Hyphomicrobium nitrativorans NL23]